MFTSITLLTIAPSDRLRSYLLLVLINWLVRSADKRAIKRILDAYTSSSCACNQNSCYLFSDPSSTSGIQHGWGSLFLILTENSSSCSIDNLWCFSFCTCYSKVLATFALTVSFASLISGFTSNSSVHSPQNRTNIFFGDTTFENACCHWCDILGHI